jgi:tetratricopeptide (TPR) repeat protein
MKEAAEMLGGIPIAAELDTPLGQRLAIALLAWGAEPEFGDPHRLGSQLAETLTSRRHGRPLWAIWQKLALSRTSVDEAMLDSLGAGRLNELARRTLCDILLDGAERLHDVLRAIPDDRAPDPELIQAQRRQVHELLFEHYYARFEAEAGEGRPEAGDHAAEALFHAGELQDETRMTLLAVDLVEELDALGHRLGTIQRDHAAAAAAFRRALLIDPDDPYATHHLAFHLDAQGLEPDEVDAGYRRAVELDPGQAGWHARRITFLADTAQLQAARRAWARVESVLAEDRGDLNFYQALHLPVATSLLSLSELSFCSYILDGVPGHARDARYRELRSLLTGRLAGQDRGAFVPAPRSGEGWWREPPERLPRRDTEGRQLTGWLAGRIDAVDDDGLDIHVARVDLTGDGPSTGRLRLSFEELSRRLLDVVDLRAIREGTFVEIGRYRGPGGPDRTGIVVLDPPPVKLPIDILPASRWKSEFGNAAS